eukprot:3495507-Pleurochrysis_carterae.AAC.2
MQIFADCCRAALVESMHTVLKNLTDEGQHRRSPRAYLYAAFPRLFTPRFLNCSRRGLRREDASRPGTLPH